MDADMDSDVDARRHFRCEKPEQFQIDMYMDMMSHPEPSKESHPLAVSFCQTYTKVINITFRLLPPSSSTRRNQTCDWFILHVIKFLQMR